MPLKKQYLAWNQPALESAAQFLLAQYVHDSMLDLENVLLVVPGRRAGQRLMEKLLGLVEKKELKFLPPQLETGGALPELLYEGANLRAGDLVTRMAWDTALRKSPSEVIQKIAPSPPSTDSHQEWQRLAGYLGRLYRELAGEGMSFADVARLGKQVTGFTEQNRWEALQVVFEKYLQTLSALKLEDAQAARLEAIKKKACYADREIILVAMADMTRVLRQMLAQVADRVTLLIYAPESYGNRFDELGCLIPAAWQDATLDISGDQLHIAAGPGEQAEQVVRWLAGFEGKYRADQIAIGVPDEQLVPHLQRELDQHDVTSRWLVGRALPETRPYRLLTAVRDYLTIRSAAGFSALVRHPDVDHWLASQGVEPGWLTEMDWYNCKHLPLEIGGRWLGKEEEFQQLKQAHAAVENLFSETSFDKQQSLAAWCEPLCQLMATIYDQQKVDPITAQACDHLAAVLQKIARIPEEICPPMAACDAISTICQEVAGETIPSEPDPTAINILGWLELALDDSRALVVTSLNEGHVPKSITGDLFLPGKLRRELDLDDNRRRYARDAYVLDVLLHTRDNLQLIVGRSDTEKNPLTPSRLLFATDEGQTIARRVIRLYGDENQPQPAKVSGRLVSTRSDSDFAPPLPIKQETEFAFLRVTDFKQYLRCPYRFYLSRVCNLEPVDDRPNELNGRQFGSLIHRVLDAFGQSDLKNSTSAEEIAVSLQDKLNRIARYHYGTRRKPAVNVQIRQAERRLTAFARWQAGRTAEGWHITHVETSAEEDKACLNVDNLPLELHGRIDRIDIHDNGDVTVFDYKTSKKADSPQETHRKKNSEWVDLQLPLYRHIVRALGIDAEVKLGYIVLPEDTTKTAALMANWSAEELSEADEVAFDIVRKIRRQEFWPPQELDDDRYDDFAAICMAGVFERADLALLAARATL